MMKVNGGIYRFDGHQNEMFNAFLCFGWKQSLEHEIKSYCIQYAPADWLPQRQMQRAHISTESNEIKYTNDWWWLQIKRKMPSRKLDWTVCLCVQTFMSSSIHIYALINEQKRIHYCGQTGEMDLGSSLVLRRCECATEQHSTIINMKLLLAHADCLKFIEQCQTDKWLVFTSNANGSSAIANTIW